jgi:hypothetical protein
MKRYLYGLLGLAAIAASSLLSQNLALGGGASCGEAGCNSGCGCQKGHYCPHCGCRLEPVCQPTCTTKTETMHKYCCACKDICIPGVQHLGCKGGCGGESCGGCESGCCAGGCDPCKKDCGDCRCVVKTVHKLLVCPETKEHCVRGCTVTWACPKCGECGSECGGCGGGPAPAAPSQGAPAPAPAPAPNGSKLPPAPKVTSTSAIEIIGTAQAGF